MKYHNDDIIKYHYNNIFEDNKREKTYSCLSYSIA